MDLTVYLRDQGAICYEAQLFNPADKRSVARFIQQLLPTSVGWIWESLRTGPVGINSEVRDLPPKRSLTVFDSNNANSLIDDILEENDEGYGRFVAIFGVDSNARDLLLDINRLRVALQDFSKGEEGPIRIAVIRICDMREQYTFVPRNPIGPIKQLLMAWGIAALENAKTRNYKKLYLARLESIYDLKES